MRVLWKLGDNAIFLNTIHLYGICSGELDDESAGGPAVMSLTDQQRRVLDAIQDRLGRQGYPPTVRELAQHLGVSIGTIQAHLRALERTGALKRRPFQGRGLSLTAPEARPGSEAVRHIPIMGPVAAGTLCLRWNISKGRSRCTQSGYGERIFSVCVCRARA